jgi:hypothetical protein
MLELNNHIERLRDRRGRLASALEISEWQIGRKIKQAQESYNRSLNELDVRFLAEVKEDPDDQSQSSYNES